MIYDVPSTYFANQPHSDAMSQRTRVTLQLESGLPFMEAIYIPLGTPTIGERADLGGGRASQSPYGSKAASAVPLVALPIDAEVQHGY